MREGGSRRVGGHQATPGLCAEVSAGTCRPSGALSCRGSQHTQRRAPPPRGPGDMGTAGKECGLLSGAAAQGHPSARRAARAAWVPLCLFAPQGRVAGAPLGHDPTPCDASDRCHMRSLVTATDDVRGLGTGPCWLRMQGHAPAAGVWAPWWWAAWPHSRWWVSSPCPL